VVTRATAGTNRRLIPKRLSIDKIIKYYLIIRMVFPISFKLLKTWDEVYVNPDRKTTICTT